MASSAMDRVSAIASQLTSPSSSNVDKLVTKSPNDIVITTSLRTPLTKARKGGLRDTPVDELLIHVLTAVRERSGIDPKIVEDVCVGNVLQPAPGFAARNAVLAAGFPVTTAANIASRFCSSGLLAIQNVASAIALGSIDVGIACGVESMSLNADKPPTMSEKLMQHPIAKDNVMPMGWTSENVAGDFNISREMQDKFAERSHNRAERARREGWTADEIVGVKTKVKGKDGELENVLVEQDDGIREGTTKEGLGKIRAAFPQWKPATTTGGNASQVTDGAAAVLMMKRSTAEKLGQPILGKFVMSTTVGLEPRVMGIGPWLAIPKVLGKVGLKKEDVELFEINEAFASMVSGATCLMCKPNVCCHSTYIVLRDWDLTLRRSM